MIEKKTYSGFPYNREEILRYSGAKKCAPDIEKLMDECIKEAEKVLTYQVCFCEFPVLVFKEKILFSDVTVLSKNLSEVLSTCETAILFGATVGVGLDRLISKYGKISPAKALMFQAIGAERIETLCNAFCKKQNEEYQKQGKSLSPRFSPGYGDLKLSLQKDIFRILNLPKNIGLTLNESMLMSPSKSVTAIVGVSNCDVHAKTGCKLCKKTDCEYRKKEQ